jgi:hypothetical protein
MICDWRSIKTGSRTRQREPLSPPTIPCGLCFQAVTYVRHAVIQDVSRTFERSRDRRPWACQDMKDWYTAASAPSARAELSSIWEEAITEHRQYVRWLNAIVWLWASLGLATKTCTSRKRLSRMKRFFSWILFDDDDYRDSCRAGGLFILRPPDVADRPREFYWTLITFMNQQTIFWAVKLLAKSMQQISSISTQITTGFFFKSNVYSRDHNSLPVVPVLKQASPSLQRLILFIYDPF